MFQKLAPLPLALTLLALPAPAAQEKAEAKAEEPTPKGFKSRIFEAKHRDPAQLADAMRSLGSGVGGARLDVNRDLKTITARDYPENLAQMEEALKRLDVPAPDPADVNLMIHVLEARKSDGTGGELPPALAETVKAIRGTLAYKGYRLLTTLTQRVKDGTRGVRGSGTTIGLEGLPDATTVDLSFEFGISLVTIAPSASGSASVKLEGFKFEAGHSTRSAKGERSAGRAAEILTDVSLKEGEQVVVGTSAFRDRGLILVVSARTAK